MMKVPAAHPQPFSKPLREIARIISTDRVTDLMLQNAASMLKDGKNPVY